MDKSYLEIVDDIDNVSLNHFVNNTKTNINALTTIEKVVSDTTWIDLVEETIPYLDTIIRNPRRFIVQEEDVAPIEKTKIISEESVKHLAQHTNFIQYVDKDDNVTPSKMLNIYREETTDLYENRFIKSLVNNLYIFVKSKLEETETKSYAKVDNKVSYVAETKFKDEDVKVSINLESHKEESDLTEEREIELQKKILIIKEVVDSFMASTFVKTLQNCEPVRSPIRKTNTILKDKNFVKAVELWEYIEANQMKPMTQRKNVQMDRSSEVKDNYNLAYYISKMAMEIKEGKEEGYKFNGSEIARVLNDAVFSANLSAKQIEKMVSLELKKILRNKARQETQVNNFFSDIVSKYNSKSKKALEYLK